MPYITISRETQDKLKLAKKFIQGIQLNYSFLLDKYQKIIENQKKYHQDWKSILNLMNKNQIPKQQQIKIQNKFHNHQQIKKRLMRIKDSIKNYQLYQLIGKGAFGQVRLAKNIQTNQIVAIKRMQKRTLADKKQLSSAYLQRDFMIKNQNSKFLVHLHSTFQDKKYLYIVMDYIGGGDLLHLLIQKDIFTEQQTRFYIAQLILALQQIHSKKYIHRDIKPDNILIDKNGHIKISDFGLSKYLPISQIKPKQNAKQSNKISMKQTQRPNCQSKTKSRNNSKKMLKTQQNQSKIQKIDKLKSFQQTHFRKYSKVGTPDYISPQVLTSDTYDFSVDIWSVGVIMFECLFGYPPFSDQNSTQVCQKVIHWIDHLIFPQQINVSIQARMLILGMMNDRQKRLTIKQIKKHPFFQNFDWNRIFELKPPMIPIIQTELDTRNFQIYEDNQNWQELSENEEIQENQLQINRLQICQQNQSQFNPLKKQRKRSSSVDFSFPGFQYRKLNFQPLKQIQNEIVNFRNSQKTYNQQQISKNTQYKIKFLKTCYSKQDLKKRQSKRQISDKKSKLKYILKNPIHSSNKNLYKQKDFSLFSTTQQSYGSKNLNYSIDKQTKDINLINMKKIKKISNLQGQSKINLQKNTLKKKYVKTQIQC